MQKDLPLLEECCQDGDWVRAALDMTEHLFWLDESKAWHWLIPRFVESLVYSRELQRGLVQVVTGWEDCLSKAGQKRVKLLRAVNDAASPLESLSNLLDELSRLERLGWLLDERETERSAILDWLRGQLLFGQKKYTEVLAWYERTERGLPEQGQMLRMRLGETLYGLAGELIWPEDTVDAIYAAEAEPILRKVTASLPDNQGAWYRLGVTLSKAGKLPDAVPVFQRAIKLDPKLAYPHNGLGNVYRSLGQPEAALAAYQRAIELDPNDAAAHNNIAGIYINQNRLDDARRELEERIRLRPENSFTPFVTLGIIARYQGLAESIEYFENALAQWETAWCARWQTPASLLENRAKALLCLGRIDEALQVTRQSIAQLVPGDTIDFDDYSLLQSAPVPPDGLDEMIALWKEAQEKRKS